MTAKEFLLLITEGGRPIVTELGQCIAVEVREKQQQGRSAGIKPPRRYSAEIFEEDESVLMALGVM